MKSFVAGMLTMLLLVGLVLSIGPFLKARNQPKETQLTSVEMEAKRHLYYCRRGVDHKGLHAFRLEYLIVKAEIVNPERIDTCKEEVTHYVLDYWTREGTKCLAELKKGNLAVASDLEMLASPPYCVKPGMIGTTRSEIQKNVKKHWTKEARRDWQQVKRKPTLSNFQLFQAKMKTGKLNPDDLGISTDIVAKYKIICWENTHEDHLKQANDAVKEINQGRNAFLATRRLITILRLGVVKTNELGRLDLEIFQVIAKQVNIDKSSVYGRPSPWLELPLEKPPPEIRDSYKKKLE